MEMVKARRHSSECVSYAASLSQMGQNLVDQMVWPRILEARHADWQREG